MTRCATRCATYRRKRLPRSQTGNQCDVCGRFLPSNQANYKHGLRASLVPRDLQIGVEQWRDAVVAAQGGLQALEDEPVRLGIVRSLVHTDLSERLVVQALASSGNARLVVTLLGTVLFDEGWSPAKILSITSAVLAGFLLMRKNGALAEEANGSC